jgi:hypothetical protein
VSAARLICGVVVYLWDAAGAGSSPSSATFAAHPSGVFPAGGDGPIRTPPPPPSPTVTNATNASHTECATCGHCAKPTDPTHELVLSYRTIHDAVYGHLQPVEVETLLPGGHATETLVGLHLWGLLGVAVGGCCTEGERDCV